MLLAVNEFIEFNEFFLYTCFHFTNHYKPFQTTSNNFKPYQTISNHFKPYQTTPNQIKPNQTISNNFKPLGLERANGA